MIPTSYVTQTTLGSWFDIPASQVGKILTSEALKDRFGATRLALSEGYAKEARTKSDIPFLIWDAERIARIIDGALGDSEKPFLDSLVAQVADGLAEAERHRKDGSEFVADLVDNSSYEGVPMGLVGLIKERALQNNPYKIGARSETTTGA